MGEPQGILSVQGVSVRFGGVQALSGVDVHVAQGSVHAIIGPNGAGKTTLLGTMAGMVPVQDGRISLDGEDVSHMPPWLRARKGIRRTFQNLEIPAGMCVWDAVAVGAHGCFSVGMWQSLFSTPAARRVEKAIAQATEEALDFVGLSHAGHREARTLPLGQQRLVELARALAGKPKVMLLDEPAAGLNIAETQALGELIRRAQVAFGLTIVLVEHDMDLVMEVSHRVTVLCFGEVLACGEPRQIQHDPRVIAAYLGGSS